jgi:two-component system nitrate/nitrite response regulator NarL
MLEEATALLFVQWQRTVRNHGERRGVEGHFVGSGEGSLGMNVVVLTPIRLLGDGLAACFSRRPDIAVLAVVNNLESVRDALKSAAADLVLIDVTQGIDLYDVRSIAADHAEVAFVALGLTEQRQEVIRCGRAGFAGYVARDASVDALCNALSDVVQGRLACPAEISCGLLRALFRMDQPANESGPEHPLTRREGDVLQLLGQGLSNKEIARELSLSVPTIKHHVHNILEKLNIARRAQAMRRVRDAPWIVSPPRTMPSRRANDRLDR